MTPKRPELLLWALLTVSALIIIVPWQGALDRIGDAAAVAPVPATRAHTADALKLLDSGVFWRVEPDYSLFLVRNVQFAERRGDWRLVTAYGPWGFLFRGYHPKNYLSLVSSWAIVAVLSVFLLVRVVRSTISRTAAQVATAAATLLVIGANPRPALLLVFPLFVFAAYFFSAKRSLSWPVCAGVAVMALLGLVKSSALALGLVVAVAIGLDEGLRKTLPRAPIIWIASILGFWFAAGQQASWLGSFLQGTWWITSAYGEAEFAGRLSFGEIALLLVSAAIVLFEIFRDRRTAIPLALIVLAFIKTSLVRDDTFHEELAPVAVLVLLLLMSGRIAKATGKPNAVVWSISIVVLLSVAPWAVSGRELFRQVRAAVRPLAAKEASDRRYDEDMRAIRSRHPLPAIEGSVDIYGEEQSIAIAHDLDYRPRPVYQSYIAYSSELATMNRDHLRGRDAPEVVLFDIAVSDERFPPLDDGLSWPALIEFYEPAGATGDLLLMHRRIAPLSLETVACATVQARLGEALQIPDDCAEPLWVEIAIDRTLWGRSVSLLYKAPELRLTVRTRGGETLSGRLLRRTAASGFLLSPVVVGPHDFGALASGQFLALSARNAESLVVSSSGEGTFYARELTVRFYGLGRKAS